MVQEPQHVEASSVVGIVTMSEVSGEGVPDVKVAVRNQASGRISETVTDKAGRFAIAGLPDGRYDAVACREGFDPWQAVLDISESSTARQLAVVVRLAT
jgi:hypothetical protein